MCLGDAIANDVLYHSLCWATVKRKLWRYRKHYTPIEKFFMLFQKYLIESKLNDLSHQILDINKVNKTYCNLLFENGLNINKICENYMKQLKILLQENIPCTIFVKSKFINQPEQICTEESQKEVAIHKSSIDQTQDINLNYML